MEAVLSQMLGAENREELLGNIDALRKVLEKVKSAIAREAVIDWRKEMQKNEKELGKFMRDDIIQEFKKYMEKAARRK